MKLSAQRETIGDSAPPPGADRCGIAGRAADARRLDRAALILDQCVAAGAISGRDRIIVEDALDGSNTPIDRAICGLALMTEDRLADLMAAAFSYRRLDLHEEADPALANAMSTEFLASRRVVPIARHDGVLRVALADPTDMTGLRGCEFALGGMAEPIIATASELDALFRQFAPTAVEETDASEHLDLAGDSDQLRDLASAEPAVRLCNRLVADAATARASDIHIEPEERGYKIRFRIDGALAERERLTIRQGLMAISRFKILGNLDIAERRRPQDGRFSIAAAGQPVDLRISSTPNVHGESVVLRLLQRDRVSFDLEALGFAPPRAAELHRLSDKPNGILLLTGPTGCGKTTTLYALLQRLAAREVKIMTIEDPVEYRIDGVSQTQVSPAIGLTFSSALRSFLRHDPDIIMVGEMRDLETARTAVQAALTGHFVLSTLHTNDAPSAVMRLLDMGVEDYLVASTLIGVIGQRLVRRICAACDAGPRDLARPPCPQCGGTGYFGRLAIAEILEMTEALRVAITAKPTAAELARIACADGFISMKADGEDKIKQGLTTRQEILKAVAE